MHKHKCTSIKQSICTKYFAGQLVILDCFLRGMHGPALSMSAGASGTGHSIFPAMRLQTILFSSHCSYMVLWYILRYGPLVYGDISCLSHCRAINWVFIDPSSMSGSRTPIVLAMPSSNIKHYPTFFTSTTLARVRHVAHAKAIADATCHSQYAHHNQPPPP